MGLQTDGTYTARREPANVYKVPVCSMPVVGTILTHRRLPVCSISAVDRIVLSRMSYHPDPVLECVAANSERLEEKRNFGILWVYTLKYSRQ